MTVQLKEATFFFDTQVFKNKIPNPAKARAVSGDSGHIYNNPISIEAISGNESISSCEMLDPLGLILHVIFRLQIASLRSKDAII